MKRESEIRGVVREKKVMRIDSATECLGEKGKTMTVEGGEGKQQLGNGGPSGNLGEENSPGCQ